MELHVKIEEVQDYRETSLQPNIKVKLSQVTNAWWKLQFSLFFICHYFIFLVHIELVIELNIIYKATSKN